MLLPLPPSVILILDFFILNVPGSLEVVGLSASKYIPVFFVPEISKFKIEVLAVTLFPPTPSLVTLLLDKWFPPKSPPSKLTYVLNAIPIESLPFICIALFKSISAES